MKYFNPKVCIKACFTIGVLQLNYLGVSEEISLKIMKTEMIYQSDEEEDFNEILDKEAYPLLYEDAKKSIEREKVYLGSCYYSYDFE